MSTFAETTSKRHSMPVPKAGVSFTDLSAYATHLVVRAARKVGTEPTVLGSVPSLDACVFRVRVGSQHLVAKVNFLGVPLATVLRGTYGDLGQIKARMATYTRTASARATTQEQHLRLLETAGLNVVTPLGVAGGVLFTQAEHGHVPLAQVLRQDPERSLPLLGETLAAVQAALRSPDLTRAALNVPACQITNSLLHGLGSNGWSLHLERTGRVPSPRVGAMVATLNATVRRLAPLVRTLDGPRSLAYGSLAPEHILVGEDPEAPILLSPYLQRTPLAADLARLVSRTALGTVTAPDPTLDAEPVFHALEQLVAKRTAVMQPHHRYRMLRNLLALWAADTAAALVAVLCTPRDVPLPCGAQAVAEQAPLVCALLHRVTSAATAYADGIDAAWRSLITDLPRLR